MADERDFKVEGLDEAPAGKKSGLFKIVGLAVIVLVVIVAVCVVFFRDKLMPSQDTTTMSDNEVVSQLRQIMDVPENETPSIATVMDVTKLAGQPFFAKAMSNDKLILYTEAKKAILYRPATHKVIEVMPLVLDAPTEAGTITSGTNQLN